MRRSRRGMALLEVLISLVVAGLFLSVLLREATASLRRLRLSDLRTTASAIARNRVEALSAWPATLPTPAQGRANGLQWTVEQVAVDRARQEATGAVVLRTFRVTVAAPDVTPPLIDLTVKRLGWTP